MAINRRDFLRLTGTGVALGTCAPLFRTPFMSAPLRAAMLGAGTDHRMIVIFLRGGADTVNAVIPHGDAEYNTANRTTLYIPPSDSGEAGSSIDLDNGFAEAHPSLAQIVDDVPGVAWVHAVGYTPYFSRSHFSGQQYWENGMPGSLEERGWLNELVVQDGQQFRGRRGLSAQPLANRPWRNAGKLARHRQARLRDKANARGMWSQAPANRATQARHNLAVTVNRTKAHPAGQSRLVPHLVDDSRWDRTIPNRVGRVGMEH